MILQLGESGRGLVSEEGCVGASVSLALVLVLVLLLPPPAPRHRESPRRVTGDRDRHRGVSTTHKMQLGSTWVAMVWWWWYLLDRVRCGVVRGARW